MAENAGHAAARSLSTDRLDDERDFTQWANSAMHRVSNAMDHTPQCINSCTSGLGPAPPRVLSIQHRRNEHLLDGQPPRRQILAERVGGQRLDGLAVAGEAVGEGIV